MRALRKVKVEWSPQFAYAIGVITTDGNLSPDGRHINVTSKDEEMILTIKKCLGLQNKIGRKGRGGSMVKKYFVLQFGDVHFYRFLLEIGLKPAKSKTLEALDVPRSFFRDFLRGCIDGDGSIGIFRHPESQHPQLRIRLYSASPAFLSWVKGEVSTVFGISSGWIEYKEKGMAVLAYAKADSLKLMKLLYYNGVKFYLGRKYNIAKRFLGE